MDAHTMLYNLSPVVHQYNWDLYRVPLRRVGNHYTLYVADGFTREFDEQTLPDEIKSKMAMILARHKQILQDHEVNEIALLSICQDEDMQEVGWRSSDSWFVIVLPYPSLMKLRGES